MIQGGCPNTREGAKGRPGTGGPGYNIKCETGPTNPEKHAPGTLSMAHAGKDTGGSQFFVTHTSTPHLDGVHTVFGQVSSGQDVVNKIAQGDKMTKVTVK
jgi:peptidyl-prolyl cis-trans isomerase B (cyclophilin B)